MRDSLRFLVCQRIIYRESTYEYDRDEWGDVPRDRRKFRESLRVWWAKLTKRD